MSDATADLLFDAKAVLGEGPVWIPRSNLLYWVDIEGCKLHCHQPKDNTNREWEFDGMLGAILPQADGRLLLAHESGLLRFDPKSGAKEKLPLLTNSDPNLRFNDGKCDPLGNIWIGTMDKELAPHAGHLYRLDKDMQTQIMVHGTSVSNGMAWAPDKSLFYYIDSPTYEVWQYNFDKLTGEISNKKVAIRIPETLGTPDGMCIDGEGMLWVAHWGGACVRRWDPETGRQLQSISVDAPHVTSCCFGGKNLDTLFITTARSGLGPDSLEKYPKSGGLFVCRTSVRGMAANTYNCKI